jgi:cytidine deaminase
MKHRKLEIEFDEYAEKDNVEKDIQKMVEEAKIATKTAYAPYSLFKVGASVRLSNGVIIRGGNQENVAYPSGLCAERVAIYAASSQYPNVDIDAIAVTVDHEFENKEEVFSPCGACRQVMAEMELKSNKKMQIIVHSPDGVTRVFNGIGQLLPFSFHNSGLNKKDA